MSAGEGVKRTIMLLFHFCEEISNTPRPVTMLDWIVNSVKSRVQICTVINNI